MCHVEFFWSVNFDQIDRKFLTHLQFGDDRIDWQPEVRVADIRWERIVFNTSLWFSITIDKSNRIRKVETTKNSPEWLRKKTASTWHLPVTRGSISWLFYRLLFEILFRYKISPSDGETCPNPGNRIFGARVVSYTFAEKYKFMFHSTAAKIIH